MTENERFAWLQLAFTPYIGAESFLVLLQQFGSAQAALNAPADKIAALVRHKQAAESWHNADKRALAQQSAEAALQWEMQDGCRLLLLQDDDFPEMLTQGITAPPVLFLRGNAELLHIPSAAIVGSRHSRQSQSLDSRMQHRHARYHQRPIYFLSRRTPAKLPLGYRRHRNRHPSA